MAISACFEWKVWAIDISAAFLQGNSLERDVFLKMPPDVCEKGKIWKLKRCIYGLNDAPRAWYERVKEEFIKLNATRSMFDQALFFWHENGKLDGVLTSHVDDFAYCGTERFHSEIMSTIIRRFKISCQAQGTFKYLGLNVVQQDGVITIDQGAYIESLESAIIL